MVSRTYPRRCGVDPQTSLVRPRTLTRLIDFAKDNGCENFWLCIDDPVLVRGDGFSHPPDGLRKKSDENPIFDFEAILLSQRAEQDDEKLGHAPPSLRRTKSAFIETSTGEASKSLCLCTFEVARFQMPRCMKSHSEREEALSGSPTKSTQRDRVRKYECCLILKSRA